MLLLLPLCADDDVDIADAGVGVGDVVDVGVVDAAVVVIVVVVDVVVAVAVVCSDSMCSVWGRFNAPFSHMTAVGQRIRASGWQTIQVPMHTPQRSQRSHSEAAQRLHG